MCDGVVPTDSSFSMSGHQESVGVPVDAHSQHVVFDVVSWCGPFRHPLLRHHEGPIILTHGPKLRPLRLFFVSFGPRGVDSRAERGRHRPTGWAVALRGESGRIGDGSELPTNHLRPHALGWERGCGDKGKNSRGQLTFDPTDRGCKPFKTSGPEGCREANATNPTAPSQSSSSFAETRQQPRTRIARPRIAFSMQDPTKGEHEPKNHHRARRHRNHDHQRCPVAHGFHLGW